MIYVTGDIHGDVYSRLGRRTGLGSLLRAGDTVIICGDFGVVWNGGRDDAARLNWLAEKPFTTVFVPGNHENYELLETFPVVPWNGAPARQLRPNVFLLLRGEVYTIGSRTFFCFGGAASHDVDGGILEPDDPLLKEKERRFRRLKVRYRVNHISWWAQELPAVQEMDHGRAMLQQHGWQVDYVITHCAPTAVQSALNNREYRPDVLTEYLQEVSGRLQFRHWYFGHYHADREIAPKFTMLYEGYAALE